MNKFIQTMSNVTHTENSMIAYKSSLNPILDLFYRVGNRTKDATVKVDIPWLFVEACRENEDLAVKVMGWSRSIRNGAGVREHIRSVLRKISNNQKVDWEWFAREGYWKDIFHFEPAYFEDIDTVLWLIKSALAKEDNLILKYLPRAKKNKTHRYNKWIRLIREVTDLTPKEYRKVCSSFVTPERLMCENKWSEIDYEKVPSICMNRNRKQFIKHDGERFNQFVADVKSGKVKEDGKKIKMNVDTLYPHQIIMPLVAGFGRYYRVRAEQEAIDFAEAQWSQLKDKFSTDKNVLVVGDTSASMNGEPLAISIGLSIYCSERIKGAFHNFACTFSTSPSFIQFSDDDGLMDKIKKIPEIVSDTNLEAVFELILHKAVKENIPKEDMPSMVLVISDMQFNEAVSNKNFNIQETIKFYYDKAGYEMPALVFWNVRDSHGLPAKADDKGVILFSGASPNNIRQAMEGEINPYAAMLRVIDKPEFNWILTNENSKES